MDSTEYYSTNADEYYEKTINLDLHESWDRFLELIPEGGSILDLGCGSGRDSAYFISMGYDVTAVDGSEEMCNLASVHIGQDVLHMKFSEMDFTDVFDGVWAFASLLHVPSCEIGEIISRVIKSLKKDGVLYMTFKYGEFEGERDGRYYTFYRTRNLKELIADFEGLEVIEIRKYEDIRPEEDEIWLHAIVKKTF